MRRMTLAQARAHFGLAASVSDAAVRAAAEAENIKIVAEAPAAPARRQQQRTQVDDEGGDDEDGDDGDDELTSALTELSDVAERLASSLDASGSRATQEQTHLGVRISEVLRAAQDAGLSTPTRTERRSPRIRIFDRFDQLGYGRSEAEPNPSPERSAEIMRANMELAGMIFGGTQSGQVRNLSPIAMPDDFRSAWQHHVFGNPDRVPWLADDRGQPTRAMDTQESGYGADLIGVQYATELWRAARNMDGLVGRIREIPMAASQVEIPIDGDLPEMLFVGESTADDASAYAASDTPSSKRTLNAKKFTIQQVWSGEMTEDSIIAWTPFLREKLEASTAAHLGSSYLNGDTETGSSGNINKDDGTPGSTKHYLAYDGIRKYWLVTATGQGKDMGGAAIDPKEFTRARGKLNGGDDDVDNLVKTINWGGDARALLAVLDWDTYLATTELDVVKTIDQYGSQATVVTGELGSLPGGIPLVSPGYASKTEADGKASDTEASNTRGQVSIFNPRGWLAGRRRDVQLYFDRIQRRDQFLFELYTRRAFNRFGGNVAAGVYNIDNT